MPIPNTCLGLIKIYDYTIIDDCTKVKTTIDEKEIEIIFCYPTFCTLPNSEASS